MMFLVIGTVTFHMLRKNLLGIDMGHELTPEQALHLDVFLAMEITSSRSAFRQVVTDAPFCLDSLPSFVWGVPPHEINLFRRWRIQQSKCSSIWGEQPLQQPEARWDSMF